ncbi:hypothetical protein LINPERPRIM_LOCUS12557 [Linum perenne]
MGNSLRCCLACVLPCGALDLIRIVHLNGYVEEITRPITAGEILHANPNHVLSKPSSDGGTVVRRILILSPDSELKRGSIYFLIPKSSLPADKKRRPKCLGGGGGGKSSSTTTTTTTKDTAVVKEQHVDVDVVDVCDRYLKEAVIADQKKLSTSSSRRHRRTGRSGAWRQSLESISELAAE